jgi:arginase family enzyme
MLEQGIDGDAERAAAGTDALYVALDLDVLDPAEVDVFFPEPGGPTVSELEGVLRGIAALRPLSGAGLTGLRAGARPDPLIRLLAALDL